MTTSYRNGIPGSFDKRGVWRETKHTPATPLHQWNVAASADTKPQKYIAYQGDGYNLTYDQAQHVAHAANAYPKLVEALVTARDELRNARQHDAADRHGNLLRSLGEES